MTRALRAAKRPRVRGLASAITVLTLAAGCSGGDDDAADDAANETTSKSTEGRETTSTTLDPEQAAVLADYEDYWTTLIAASDPPTPDSAELAEHATGEELDRAREAVTARERAGESLRGSYAHDAGNITIDDDEAELSDCLAAEVAVHDTATGAVESTYPTQAQSLVVVLERESDTWKVALISPGTANCR